MKFKLNYLPEEYEGVLIPLMNLNNKLVLGGSLALHILDIMDYDFKDRKPDFDISLLEPLKFNDLDFIKDFLGLDYKKTCEDYMINHTKPSPNPKNPNLKSDLIQLCKTNFREDGSSSISYIIDFFTSLNLSKKELVLIEYKGMTLKLVHPSMILSYKSKYAYDYRVGKQFKHFTDIKNIDWEKYFKIVKNIESVYDKNGSIANYTYNIIKSNNPLPF
jgi:hypothetical protein